MPSRKTLLVRDQIYHVFNKGVAGLPIFNSQNQHQRFMDLIQYYRFANLPLSFSNFKQLPKEVRDEVWNRITKNTSQVEIISFCLMDNHFHFLLKQKTESGIKSFMANLQNGYAKYYNLNNRRAGPLFQSIFKAVRVETDEQLLHVSRYIHLNPSTGYLVNISDLINYPWSSLPEYILDKKAYQFINKDIILDLIGGVDKYWEFVFDQAQYQRELGIIKHLALE